MTEQLTPEELGYEIYRQMNIIGDHRSIPQIIADAIEADREATRNQVLQEIVQDQIGIGRECDELPDFFWVYTTTHGTHTLLPKSLHKDDMSDFPGLAAGVAKYQLVEQHGDPIKRSNWLSDG